MGPHIPCMRSFARKGQGVGSAGHTGPRRRPPSEELPQQEDGSHALGGDPGNRHVSFPNKCISLLVRFISVLK